MEDILHSVQEQRAIEAAPRTLDPLQQTVITLLRGYLDSPDLAGSEVRECMRRLRQPMGHSAIRRLRRAYDEFQRNGDIGLVLSLIMAAERERPDPEDAGGESQPLLTREDLHLVCFDFVCS